MNINTDMSPQEVTQLNYKVDGFNKKLQEEQKIVSKNTLGEADFMKLLITQLKTQDPTKPLEDKEFIGQMTQFTSLKQMNSLTDSFKNFNKEFSFTKAVGLVNKNISWMDENGKSSVGMVDSIRVKNGDTFLNVEGNEVPLEQIREVFSTKLAQNVDQSGVSTPASAVLNAMSEYQKSSAPVINPAMTAPEEESSETSATNEFSERELERPLVY